MMTAVMLSAQPEFAGGYWEKKIEDQRRHAVLQCRIATLLTNALCKAGDVGTDWCFYLLPPNDRPSSLVPNVAFVAHDRRRTVPIAPDIAVEVVMPGERRGALNEKIGIYLRTGTHLVIVVDPERRIAELHQIDGISIVPDGDVVTCCRYPDLRLDLGDLFSSLDIHANDGAGERS
jgi:Uma2 family endonuclease